MSLITWNDYFVTGIDIIDEQHRWLIDLINRAATVLVMPYASTHEAADELLDQLTEYAVFHFQTEARLMTEYGIDRRHAEHHIAAHNDFAAHVGEMRERYERTGDISGGELLTFLANWLVFHILSDDQVLGHQLVAIRSGSAANEAFEKAEGKESDPALQAKTQALIDLYQLINQQYSNLQAVYQELGEYRDHLEQKVAQRTEQLAQARDQAEAASRAKSVFLANMSHEFRTPMNAIVGMSWALLQQIDNPAQREKLQIIAKASERLQDILGEVLDMVKLESGELTLEPVDFSLHALLAHAHAAAAMAAEAKGLRFVAEIPPELPDLLHGDARRLGKMLEHLLANAVKFTESGEIRLRAETARAGSPPIQLSLTVSDTGKGIAADDINLLFRPFAQLDAASARAQGGTGLGLALCKRISRLMGGDIAVSSELGHGSSFSMTILLQAAHSPHPQSEASGTRTDAADGGGAPVPPVDWPNVRRHLERLRPLIAEDDIQALSAWNESADLLHGALGPNASQIGHELEAYNFEHALQLLDRSIAGIPGRE